MENMCQASIFNKDISNWDVSKVENFRGIFYDADFNQNIDNWKPRQRALSRNMFKGSPLENNPPIWYKK